MVQKSTFDRREAVIDDPSRHETGVSQRELRMVLIGLMMALALAALDQNIVATALPRITGDLGGFQHFSWVVTAFIVTSTVSAPLYGRLKRPLRAEIRLFGLDLRFPGRLYRLRFRGRPSSAHFSPAPAGIGSGRFDRTGADGDRRPGVAARARALPGLVRRCFRRMLGRGPADRRTDHAVRVMALDILCQPAGRRRRAGADPGFPSSSRQRLEAAHRFRRSRFCWLPGRPVCFFC